MIWNTIAHPRMMDDTSGTSNEPAAFDNVVFSKEALEPPFKHMNRDFSATFDVIVMGLLYNSNSLMSTVKSIPFLGDYDTVYRAVKSGALLHVMYITKFLMLDQDGILQPANGPIRFYMLPALPIVLEGKYENGYADIDDPIDFKDDRFVVVGTAQFDLVFSSAGEIYEYGTWYNDILPKYIITGTDSESENSN